MTVAVASGVRSGRLHRDGRALRSGIVAATAAPPPTGTSLIVGGTAATTATSYIDGGTAATTATSTIEGGPA